MWVWFRMWPMVTVGALSGGPISGHALDGTQIGDSRWGNTRSAIVEGRDASKQPTDATAHEPYPPPRGRSHVYSHRASNAPI